MAEPEEEEEEEAYDVVETEAKAFVRAILKSLVEKLRTSRDVNVKKITSEMITCLSRYYTLQEMVLHMVSTTKVTVEKTVEFYVALTRDNTRGGQAYTQYSTIREAARKEATRRQQQQIRISQFCGPECNHEETSTSGRGL
ncbi:unnamed protein product [Cochlearia groenlandica]